MEGIRSAYTLPAQARWLAVSGSTPSARAAKHITGMILGAASSVRRGAQVNIWTPAPGRTPQPHRPCQLPSCPCDIWNILQDTSGHASIIALLLSLYSGMILPFRILDRFLHGDRVENQFELLENLG